MHKNKLNKWHNATIVHQTTVFVQNLLDLIQHRRGNMLAAASNRPPSIFLHRRLTIGRGRAPVVH